MKAFALFAAALIVVVFAGCQENAVEPIISKNVAKPAPAFRTLQIKENLAVTTPDGLFRVLDIAGEITYSLVPLEQASLGKEIPVEKKQIYDLRISGKGEIMLNGSAAAGSRVGLAKPETWSFSGVLTSIVGDGSSYVNVVFTIDGAKWISHYHVTFFLAGGMLNKGEGEVDFHQTMQ
jgi:hypothetical protein